MFLQTIYIENTSIVFDENNFFCCENKSNLLSINNVGTIGGWTMPYETFEEKYNRMKMDKFKKDYPIFSNIQHNIKFGKTGYNIYNSEYLKETGNQSLFLI